MNSLQRKVVIALAVALVMLAGACKSGRGRPDDGKLEKKPPIKAQSVDAQKRFDRAVEHLQEGRYAQARESFRLVQAEFGGDPIAQLAELYIARSAMGDIGAVLGAGVDQETYAGSPEALRIFKSLSRSDDVDQRVRYAAQAYHGLELAVRDQHEAAYEALADYPGPSMSTAVLRRDRIDVWALVIEALDKAERYPACVEAAAKLWALVQQERAAVAQEETAAEVVDAKPQAADASVDPADARLESMSAFARQRAFSVARDHLEEATLQDFLPADLVLLRAAAGWGLLLAQLDDGVEEEQRAALEDLFNRISADLVTAGAAERAAELSMRLAAVGGPKRLAIGVLLPLSGPVASIGERAMAGMLVAMRSFRHGGHPEVTLVFQDSQADPQAAFEALVEQDILAIVGPLDSRRARRFAPLAQEAGVPLITLTTESAAPKDAEADAKPFVFRNFIDAAAEARAVARIAFDQIGDRRAAVVFPDVGYGRVTSRAFAEEFRRLGGQVVAEVGYDRSQSDFATVASKVASARRRKRSSLSLS